MASQTVPPPPAIHHSPVQVSAAARIASLSKPSAGIPGDRVGAPQLLSGVGVVRGDVAAHPVFGAAVADDHRVARDPGRPRDRVVGAGRGGLGGPAHRSVVAVQRDEAAVEEPGVDEVALQRDTAVDVAAAGAGAAVVGIGDARVPAPDFVAGGRVQREDEAERTGCVQHAVHDKGRGLQAGPGLGDFPAPRQTEPADVLGV